MSLVAGNKIRGLVDASGCGGCSVGSSNDWNLTFHFASHRIEGQLTRSALRCEISMDHEVMQQWMSRINPYSVLEANVTRLTDQGVALLSDLKIVEDEDRELAAIREELLVPIFIQTPLFGTLKLDRRGGDYNGGAEWCGVKIRLSISCPDYTNPNAAVAAAETLFRSQEDWSKRVSDFAADRLLDLKNENWLDEDEKELPRRDFISCMALEEISVDENGDFSFWHDDGDLFWGHTILIRGNLVGGLFNADIAG